MTYLFYCSILPSCNLHYTSVVQQLTRTTPDWGQECTKDFTSGVLFRLLNEDKWKLKKAVFVCVYNIKRNSSRLSDGTCSHRINLWTMC